MSSNQQKETSKPATGSDAESLPGPSSKQKLDANIQPTEQKPSSSSDESKGFYCEPSTSMGASASTSKPKAKSAKSSSTDKPAPFKEFPKDLLELPLAKEAIAEKLTLEEACGFLPHLMKTKRYDLKSKENDVDQISIDLQKTLNNAKNICILLEKSVREEPKDINSARILAQKLNYHLSSSYCVFQKLDRLGKDLKQTMDLYCKQTGDYHVSVDILLDYIVESILEKCKELQEG